MSTARFLRFALFTLVLFATSRARAAGPDDHGVDSASSGAPDYLFARPGGFSATVASGLPFLGIGELAYGVSNRFSVGLFTAATPDIGDINGTLAIGLRPRGVAFQSGDWRSVIVVPVLYYPEIKGFGNREPWMLTRPTLSVERALPGGARVSLGVGVIAAACTDSLFSFGKEKTMEGGIWNTATLGFGIPISKRTSLFAEGSLVLHGVKIADDWIGGSPVIAFGGFVTAL